MPKGPQGQKRPADVSDELLSMEHLCKIMDDAKLPKKRGPYKKQELRSQH